MSKNKLLLRGPYPQSRIDFIGSLVETDWDVHIWDPEEGQGAFDKALAEARALVSMSWRAGSAPAPNLGLLQLPGAGLDQIDFRSVPEHTSVCNVYEHEIGIAEFIVLAMLEWEIRLSRMDAELRKGLWTSSFSQNAPLHGELHGKSVGFVGFGRIAQATAARLEPFGLSMSACTRSPDRAHATSVSVEGMDRLDALLACSDYVIVSCPLNDATRGLIDRGRFEAMRGDAVLINVGRGPIVVERDLYEACRDGAIGGAVIDTWYRYPAEGNLEPFAPSEFEFEMLANVIMSPHASGWSRGLLDRRWKVICANLDRLARGEALINLQN